MKFGITMMALGVCFGFAETWYFGWNLTPSCHAERVCDTIAVGWFFVGLGWHIQAWMCDTTDRLKRLEQERRNGR